MSRPKLHKHSGGGRSAALLMRVLQFQEGTVLATSSALLRTGAASISTWASTTVSAASDERTKLSGSVAGAGGIHSGGACRQGTRRAARQAPGQAASGVVPALSAAPHLGLPSWMLFSGPPCKSSAALQAGMQAWWVGGQRGTSTGRMAFQQLPGRTAQASHSCAPQQLASLYLPVKKRRQRAQGTTMHTSRALLRAAALPLSAHKWSSIGVWCGAWVETGSNRGQLATVLKPSAAYHIATHLSRSPARWPCP